MPLCRAIDKECEGKYNGKGMFGMLIDAQVVVEKKTLWWMRQQLLPYAAAATVVASAHWIDLSPLTAIAFHSLSKESQSQKQLWLTVRQSVKPAEDWSIVCGTYGMYTYFPFCCVFW